MGGHHVDPSQFITLCESDALQMVKTDRDGGTVCFHATVYYRSELGFLSRFLLIGAGAYPRLSDPD